MSRTRLTWSDDELAAIMDAIRRQDRAIPHDNARFLDGLIDDVRAATGRLYGAATYARLLRDLAAMTGVARRPSTSTIQKAIARAQAGAPASEATTGRDSAVLDEETLRRVLGAVLGGVSVSNMATGKEPGPGRAQPDLQTFGEEARRRQLAEASLADALKLLQAAERNTADLQRQLAIAGARAEVAESQTAAALASILEAFNRSELSAAALANVARDLAGTERFLKLQNDAVRTAASTETDRLKDRIKHLETHVDQLLLENDQYRRAAHRH